MGLSANDASLLLQTNVSSALPVSQTIPSIQVSTSELAIFKIID